MYKLFLCLRYLRKRRIAFFAIMAVFLCTAMVLIVSSVMGGFLEMVRERSRGLLGDLIMDNSSMQGFAYYQEFIDKLKKEMPDKIVEATPVIYSYGLLRFPNYNITKAVRVVGIHLDAYQRVNDFSNSLYYNKHYPGTTRLDARPVAVWGLDADLMPRLPDDLMAAREKWLATVTDPKEKEKYKLERATGYPGPGIFMDCPETKVEEILAIVAEQFKVDPKTLADPKADESVARIRRIAVHLVRNFTLRKDEEIAPQFGLSGPEAVYEADENVKQERVRDSGVNQLLNEITARLVGPRYVGPAFPGLIIGLEMITQRSDEGESIRVYPRGEKVVLGLFSLTRKGVESGIGSKQIAMQYMDDSRTGVFDIDNLCVYGDFGLFQQELGMAPQERADGSGMTPARASQISIKLAPGLDPYEMRNAVQEKWKDFYASIADGLDADDVKLMHYVTVETWEQRQREFIAAVEKEKVLVTILFAIISIVAVFLVGCIFYMIVQEKTRDIGIVKSVGATSRGVASIFLSYGAGVGIVGSVLGTAFGTVFVRYINEMQDALAKLNPNLRVWSPAVYTFDRIPNQVDPKEAVVIVGIAILASMLGSLVAAMRAARVWPVEALRYE